MRFRKLRIGWSVAWGVVAVLLCVLWVRSYWWRDAYYFAISKFTFVGIASSSGATMPFSVANGVDAPFGTWQLDSDLIDRGHIPVTESPGYRGVFGFGVRYESSNSLSEIVAPYWFCVVVAGALASVPWLSFRFSLRALLIMTALVAVALGVAMWTVRV